MGEGEWGYYAKMVGQTNINKFRVSELNKQKI